MHPEAFLECSGPRTLRNKAALGQSCIISNSDVSGSIKNNEFTSATVAHLKRVQEMPAQTGVGVGGRDVTLVEWMVLGLLMLLPALGGWQRDPSTCMAPSEILLKGRGSPCFGHNFYLFYLLLHARHNLPG